MNELPQLAKRYDVSGAFPTLPLSCTFPSAASVVAVLVTGKEEWVPDTATLSVRSGEKKNFYLRPSKELLSHSK